MTEIYVTGDHPAAAPLPILEQLSLEHWAHPPIKTEDRVTSADVQNILGNFAVSNGKKPANERGDDHAARPNKLNESVPDQPVLNQDRFAEVAKTVMADAMSRSLTRSLCFDKETLAYLLQDPRFKGEQAQALLALYQNYDQLHKLNTSIFAPFEAGLTDDILDKFQSIEKKQAQLQKDSPEIKLVSGVLASCASVAKGAAGCSDSLYGPGDPLKSITADAVKQGTSDDSSFDAVVAALATSRPELLHDQILDHLDGHYSVEFPGAVGWGPYIARPSEAELGAFNHGGKTGVWPAVLEKAYGKYQNAHSFTPESNPPQNGAARGTVESAIVLLTGKHPTKIDIASTSQADLATRLAEAFSQQPPKAVVTSIDGDSLWKRATFQSSDKTADNFYKHSAYTITGFKSDGRGGGTVVIRNPKGGDNGTADGTKEIPLDQFKRNFSDISVF